MFFDRMEQNPGARFLFILACLVVVVHGLRLAAPILLPFSLALFLAVLSLPIMFWLLKRRIPAPLAIFLAVMVDVAVFGLLILMASQSVTELQDRLPTYVERFRGLQASWIANLETRGIPVGSYITTELLDPSAIVNLLGTGLSRAASLLTNAFLVLLIMFFILGEAIVFPEKVRALFGGDTATGRLAKIVHEVQEYLGIKTLVSLATGVLLGLWAWVMGLDFPILLGVVAFVLNYVPTIGSVLASFPAILLGVIQYGLAHALLVAAGYLGVNLVFGNIIEPSMMGRRLGMSTLVVILSLLFWGWVWGPVGALLAVPLTMIVKIMMENTQDLRWVAVLLDKNPPRRVQDVGPGPANADLDGGV